MGVGCLLLIRSLLLFSLFVLLSLCALLNAQRWSWLID